MAFDMILFDLDGTLTDSGPGIMNCFRYAFEKMGHEVPDHLERFIGPPLEYSFSGLCGMTEEEAVRAVAFFRERYFDKGVYENIVYDGVTQMLDRLSAAGCTLAVSTSKAEHGAHLVLDHFGLTRYFAAVCGSDPDCGRNTKTEVIEHTIGLLGSPDKQRVLMIGDRDYDITGAHGAGVSCMGALWGYGSRTELEGAGADMIALSPQDAADMICGQINGGM
ncbi:MAG: HAD hydrolase-like protein [Oscillospiraceae bacterium]|nr:HAD hydrolase-like protein [Oscillospiraceae bacterium]